MRRRKNGDDLLRKLERAAESGGAADIAAYWKACLRARQMPKHNATFEPSWNNKEYLVWTLYPEEYVNTSQKVADLYGGTFERVPDRLLYDGISYDVSRKEDTNVRHVAPLEGIQILLDYYDTMVWRNPHGDELLRSLERSGDSLRLEAEKHRRGMPSKICQNCQSRMWEIRLNNGTKLCECCFVVHEDAELAEVSYPYTWSGYAPVGYGFFHNFAGYPIMKCIRHTAGHSGWRNVTGRRSLQHHYQFIDAHGRFWYGLGAGPGMYLRIHMAKKKPRPAHLEAIATREAQARWRLEHGC